MSIISTNNPLEKELKFKQWLQSKSIRDKAIELLDKLSVERADDENDLREVAISLCSIDRLLDNTKINTINESSAIGDPKSIVDSASKNKSSNAKPQKPLRNYWMKWTMEHHTFNLVELTNNEYNQLSAATKEYIQYDKEQDKYILPSLKYFFLAIPKKPNEKIKPLTNDQKVLNQIFNREMKRIWLEAKNELINRLSEYIARNEQQNLKSIAFESKSKEDSNAPIQSSNIFKQRQRLETQCLNDLSIKQLNKWVEEDEDKLTMLKNEEAAMKAKEAKQSHEIWLKKKDSSRIRIPDNIIASTSNNQSKLLQLQTLSNSGMKYIHITNSSKELEQTKQQIKQMNNNIMLSNSMNELNKEVSDRNYEQWLIVKDMIDKSIKCLQLIEKPISNQLTSQSTKQLNSQSTSQSLIHLPNQTTTYPSSEIDRAIAVGKALKAIDRTLVNEWINWCEGAIKSRDCNILWDAFEPKACDIHSVAYSQLRDTFLKLLKPNVDYRSAFIEFVSKLPNKKNRNIDDNNIDSLSLTKEEMRTLLKQLGIDMKPKDIRVLIDCFDDNSDGIITLSEFFNFIESNSKSKKSNRIDKCCFLTTDIVTGMTNAFVISDIPRVYQYIDKLADSKTSSYGNQLDSKSVTKLIKSESKADSKIDSKYEEEDDRITGKKTIKTFKNGEKRMYIELKGRQMREDVLNKYGIIKSNNTVEEKTNDYDDDFDEQDEKEPEVCSQSKWTIDDRAKGLQFLLDASRVARQESALKTMLSQGKPPRPPNMWIDMADSTDSPAEPDELRIYWQPQKGDLISFYSLEFGGLSVGGSKSDVSTYYKEIYRDPVDATADLDFTCHYTMRDLKPGTSYLFRIRGINGYGPGEFLYKVFTTRPSTPSTPLVTFVSSDSITLRWNFSRSFFKRLDELKKVFQLADTDRSGQVDREELLAILDENVSSSNELKKFLDKAASNMGINVSQGYTAMFDMIEGDDNGGLSWKEFESFFMTAGWTNTINQSTERNSVTNSINNSISQTSSTLSTISYVVEKCENEITGNYSTALKTNSGDGLITRLESGQSYRFRVYAVNVDGISSRKSDSIIVHTMLETPSPPVVKSLASNSITIYWKPRVTAKSTRSKEMVDKMLVDWTGSHNEDRGVSIEAAFAKYDKNGSGDIDATELATMLDDLGVPVTEESIRDALQLLDINGDGTISFEEFSLWWRREEVSYTLKRSEAVPPISYTSKRANLLRGSQSFSKGTIASSIKSSSRLSINQTTNNMPNQATNNLTNQSTNQSANQSSSQVINDVAVPIVVYRGNATSVVVSGLEPNKFYHLKLRYSGSRSNSLLSRPLRIMTLPLPPVNPTIVDLGPTSVRIKWYPPKFGAYKFIVQMKSGDEKVWSNVFNSQETLYISTTLSPDTSYAVRVVSVNYQGATSEPSNTITIVTSNRNNHDKEYKHVNKVDSTFTIECTNDLSIGDTILITERLYGKIISVNKSNSKESNSEYLGERTIAAHIVKDNYKTVRDTCLATDRPVNSISSSNYRIVWLEVIWVQSKLNAEQFKYKAGEIIERKLKNLQEFEIYRSLWYQEKQRMRLEEEWALLQDCYLQYDC